MALKHVKEYFKQCEEQYLELLKDSSDFDEALKGGFISQEVFDNAAKLLDTVKSNYERLAYIIFLFNLPKNDKRLNKYKKQHSKLYNEMVSSNFSEEMVIKEDEDVLDKFKELKNLTKEKK